MTEPISQPFCLPFVPAMNPPANKVIKEMAVVMTPNDASCIELNRKMSENTKLLIINKENIAIMPKIIALP